MSCRIAVVGISAELPSGSDLDGNLDHNSFYDFILSGREAYVRLPSDRLNISAWQGTNLGQIKPNTGTFLENVDLFDNVEFGVSSRDAQAMSPSTRKLIEHAFLALLDSGIDYRARNVGCFAAGVNYHLEHNEYDVQVSMAGPPSMIANRVSYHLDLTGPSIPLDTACSSTCSTFHLACTAIQSGDCEAAVVAGCQLNLGFLDWFHYSQASMLSRDGKCKPFDASADGFSRGEAVVAVVLKPLRSAIDDNDHVYATVLGTGVTSTGSAAPPGAPVANAQFLAMQQAFQRAERSPRDVDYVECHATGTAKGDPEEVNWIIEHFGREKKLWLGSVKGNIGHTEIAAFLASLSKGISILQSGVIPPNVNLRTKNTAINWSNANVDVPLSPQPLTCRTGIPPLISIASSGIGGVNGHVVLEAPPAWKEPPSCSTTSSHLVFLAAGGLTPRSAGAIAETISKQLLDDPEIIHKLAEKAGRMTRQMIWRTWAIVDRNVDAQITFPPAELVPRKCPPIVFVFSGQGPQYKDMGRELWMVFPIFRQSIVESDNAYRSITGKSLIHNFGLFEDSKQCALSDPWPVEVTLPALAAFQMAVFDLLTYVGVKPDVVLGHSAGETALLYACGAGTKALAMSLAVARGKAFASIATRGGTMAALSCSVRQARALINACNPPSQASPHAEIACHNAPEAVAISGGASHIDAVLELAALQGIGGKKLRTTVPTHSSMMELCAKDYKAFVSDVFSRYPGPHIPCLKTYSSTTGEAFDGAFDAEYFWSNARLPVQFTSVMESISASHPKPHFVEISPHSVLSPYVAAFFQDARCINPTSRRPRSGGAPLEHHTFLQLIGALLQTGFNQVNFSRLGCASSSSKTNRKPVIPYPFQPKSFPLYTNSSAYMKQMLAHNGPLNHPFLRINADTHPDLIDHSIRQQPIMCAAGFLEMAFEFGANILLDVKLHRILSLSSTSPLPISVQLDGFHWSVKSTAPSTPNRSPSIPEVDALHADGYLSFEEPPAQSPMDIHEIKRKCTSYVNNKEMYASLQHYDYGPTFRRLIEAHYGFDEAIALVRCQDTDLLEHNYRLHPAILDACFHIACFSPLHGNTDPNTYYLPEEIGIVILHSIPSFNDLPDKVYAHCKLENWQPYEITYKITVVDMSGKKICSLEGFKVKAHLANHPNPIYERFDVLPIPMCQRVSSSPQYNMTPQILMSKDEPDKPEAPLPTAVHPDRTPNHIHAPLQVDAPLWNPDEDILFHYVEAGEMDLQACLGGLDNTHSLNVWITAMEGRGGDEATGISRVLRKEYPAWTFRLVLFASSFDDEEKRDAALRSIPSHCVAEIEFTFSEAATVTMPRVSAISAPVYYPSKRSIHPTMPIQLPHILDQAPRWLIEGLIVSTLAPSLSVYRHKHRFQKLRVLLTHCQSEIGQVVSRLYHSRGIDLTEVGNCATPLQLYLLGPHTFDLVISGYETAEFLQLSHLLLRGPTGRVFFWNFGETRLEAIMTRNPVLIRDALISAVQDIETPLLDALLQSSMVNNGQPEPSIVGDEPLFLEDKAYILIGLGSLGIHVALWMYESGAKNILLVSRSGIPGLDRPEAKLILRIIKFLQSRVDLDLRIAQFDASDTTAMRECVQEIPLKVGGCFLLTNNASDTLFANSTEEDFTHAYRSTYGVFMSLKASIDLESLDFLVIFSSVSAIFGNAGQSSYAASKLVVDSIAGRMGNACSFVCPPIAGSGLVRKVQQRRQNFMTRWQLTIQELMIWIEDAIRLIYNGHHLKFYIPTLAWDQLDADVGITRIGSDLLTTRNAEVPVLTEGESVSERLVGLVKRLLDISTDDLLPEVPLTAFGMDSLIASRLSLLLQNEFSLQFSQLRLLANASLLDIQKSLPDASGATRVLHGREVLRLGTQMMTSTLSSLLIPYSTQIPRKSEPATTSHALPMAVLLTGSTGALGAHVLQGLIESKPTPKIYALNRHRPEDTLSIQQRQSLSLRLHGLPESTTNSPYISFIEYDPCLPMMGLSSSVIEMLRSSVTHIIHSAWKTDFVAELSHFNDLIQTTRSLLNIARSSTMVAPPAFFFISTIGVCQFASCQTPVVEEAITSEMLDTLGAPKLSDNSGYLQSKWIAEELVRQVGQMSGMKICILRVGLLSGSRTGAWDTSHWFPAMVKSALYLNCLPTGTDVVSWLPMDSAAAVILDMVRSSAHGVVHIVHPRPAAWSSIIAVIAESLSVPLVSYSEWLRRLEEDTQKPQITDHSLTDHNPAIPLLSFFHQASTNLITPRHPTESLGLSPLVDCRRAQLFSPIMNDSIVARLSPRDCAGWLAYWRATGFLR